jgi:aryl-alcohol dehydrogenase-like predicted oxidoreductase
VEQVCLRSYAVEENFQRLDRAERLGEEKGLTAAPIALAYVANQPMDTYLVVGASNGERFGQNLAGSSVQLTSGEMDWLDLRSETY